MNYKILPYFLCLPLD